MCAGSPRIRQSLHYFSWKELAIGEPILFPGGSAAVEIIFLVSGVLMLNYYVAFVITSIVSHLGVTSLFLLFKDVIYSVWDLLLISFTTGLFIYFTSTGLRRLWAARETQTVTVRAKDDTEKSNGEYRYKEVESSYPYKVKAGDISVECGDGI